MSSHCTLIRDGYPCSGKETGESGTRWRTTTQPIDHWNKKTTFYPAT
ncbi:hypothetical protein N9M41_00460 [Rhodopirellula sp.]|nr:hypothetical protein [Rhodopirellula sp.]MDA9778396.1 hypothetical protein [Rubripirellula sp.]